VNTEPDLVLDTAEDFFEDAPCGYVVSLPDGTIAKVNRTLERWTGFAREELVGKRRFQELLTPGGQIYHETHFAPLLRMQSEISEIALEVLCADGTRLPVLVNSVLHDEADGRPGFVRTTIFDASDRRRYEQELLRAGRREKDIALELQRSMLADAFPETPELDLEVAYHPGVRGLEVGGDWYDAFAVGDGATIALVVGDVVGRGIGAASTMGQLRSAVRALAGTGLEPTALLTALDGFVRRHDVGRMATVAYATLDLGTRELCYACAGHPPPLFVLPGREPFFSWEGRSVPLDAFARGNIRRQASLELEPGAALMLYTDGLIERRATSVDEGLERLRRAAGDHRDAAPGALADAVVADVRDDTVEDDVCLLAARLRT
jgi:PAS domain S-box-containing protein